MTRLLRPFLLTITAVLALAYTYVAWRLTPSDLLYRAALLVPFALVWMMPAVYWGSARAETRLDIVLLQASYLSMGGLSFLVVLTLLRDVIVLSTASLPQLARVHDLARDAGPEIVFAGSVIALLTGVVIALRPPRVHRVDVAVPDLHPDLDGFRIAQLSDLHVGRTIRERYVSKVVAITAALEPDLVALTGDLVDGSVERLRREVAPLRALAAGGRGFFVLGNHDCYAGPRAWAAHFRELGFRVLLNEHVTIDHRGARLVVAGVLDPALRPGPLPDVAARHAPPGVLRLLLAHNPKCAPEARRAGFDLQLSGHTHGGQFFPWTLVVRRVHAPHAQGLSKEGPMWVYVSPGTGTWGPPVRLGTRPEVTLIRLVRAQADSGAISIRYGTRGPVK